ncbi:hypothetical protein F4775DRAFT_496094 [Biscogniauxia sp. FL1348]|nr:hypothetical protein F4775DRAFT_496094 [Biscogniauxia sp. FL1348]
MSLNGLDDAKVKVAYEAAAGEPGGWFLLKYVSRDEVDLLGSGNGGVVEIRNAVANYEEPSPLYGFLRYRRRNVIVRYMPENCSRLIQARATVHFNSVCERFAPYNTKFEITTAKDLKDSKLSAACSLHAASGSSSSSSSSLRRRRLNEIAEEEEEEERERKRQSLEKEDDANRPVSSIYSEAPRSPLPSDPPVILDPQQLTAPQGTTFASTNKVPNFTGTERPVSPASSDIIGRLSSQSSRPGLYGSSAFSYGKPKVKLAPRPSVDGKKRPSTSANFRPIANLPAGFKFFAKSLKKGKSDNQDQGEKSAGNRLEIPQENENQLPLRPATSSGASMKSITPSMSPSTKESKMTPEKARLMKAMRMREKKMQESPLTEPPTTATAINASAVEKGVAATKELKKALHVERSDNYRSVSNADSAIAVDPPTPVALNTEDRSEGTVSDSHPPSPTAASVSEIGDSTKASSLSESTEETIQGMKETGRDTEEEDGPEELSEIVEEAGLSMSIVETAPESASEPTEGLHDETKEADVSDRDVIEAAEESHEIPEAKQEPAQTNEPAVEEPSVVAEKQSEPEPEPVPEPAVKEKEPVKAPLGIPTSKFSSSSESKSPTSPITPILQSKISKPELKIPAETAPAVPEKETSIEKNDQPKDEPTPTSTFATKAPASQISTRRKASVEPIKTNLDKGTTRDPLDDDALMAELQTATLQEAKPILVSKSPVNSALPANSPNDLGRFPPRTPSSPMHGSFLNATDVPQSPARSVASGGSSYPNNVTRQPSNAGLLSKKGMSSSISQRIKALEKLSGSAGEEPRPRTAAPSSTIFIVRKGSVRDASKSSIADRASTIGIGAQSPGTPERPQDGTPEGSTHRGRGRSSSVAKRLSMFEPPNAPHGRPESIQVTARIIRDASQSLRKTDTLKIPTESSTVELKQSPLLVDMQTAQPAKSSSAPGQVSVNGSSQDQQGSNEDGEKKARRRSSLNVMKDFIKDRKTSISNKSTDNLAATSPSAAKSPSRPPSSQQNSDNLTRRMSISSYRSSASRDRDNAGSPMSPSVMSDSGSGEDDKGSGDKKSKNRASRFMRRLSNSFGPGRKSVGANISPTVAEEDPDQLATAPTEKPLPSPPTVTYMGDVDVQFPDNLLWKRRSMCLDSQGFMILSAVQGAAPIVREKAGVKRYHMSDVRTPFIPDVEVQELPNSIVLELVEGSSLQVACGDRAGQMNVLHILQEAHRNHASFGQ